MRVALPGAVSIGRKSERKSMYAGSGIRLFSKKRAYQKHMFYRASCLKGRRQAGAWQTVNGWRADGRQPGW